MKDKKTIKFILLTLGVTLIGIPVCFNFLFVWESGLSHGETSDWFGLYGNIFGGLIGGFFTYLALMLTIEDKKKEMRPKIDIPHQSIEFIDGDQFAAVVIELNNIGGTIAKNIECSLTIDNYDAVISSLEKNKDHLQINFIKTKTRLLSDNSEYDHKVHLMIENDTRNLGSVYANFRERFIGSCIPLTLNYEAKARYIFDSNLNNWINYIVRKREYTKRGFNKDELFDFILEVKYSSNEYGDFLDRFKLVWDFIGIYADENGLKFQYVIKSERMPVSPDNEN